MYSPSLKLSHGMNNSIFQFCAIFRVFQNRVTYISSAVQALGLVYAAACRLILLIGSLKKPSVKVQPTGDQKSNGNK